jgi:hypothetical protein
VRDRLSEPEDAESVVDGFTITHGGGVDHGGAIRCVASSPTIRNCILAANWAGQYGGALYNSYGASPLVEGCTFEHNVCSSSRIFGRGGAVANRHDSGPTIRDCSFVENGAAHLGGAIGNFDSSHPRVLRCTFQANSTSGHGAGVANCDDSTPEYTGCVFAQNAAKDDGGALYNESRAGVTLTGCIVYANYADDKGAAVDNEGGVITLRHCTINGNFAGSWCGGVRSSGGDVRIEDSILWANADQGPQDAEAAQLGVTAGGLHIDYCCVQGLTATHGGVGNITSDPLFVNPDVGDFHLKSQGWRWFAGREKWVRDGETSPCIDAGDPSQPLGDEPTLVPNDPSDVPAGNTRIDVGAFGGTAEASLAPPGWMLRSDVNNDRLVDWLDLAVIAGSWLAADPGPGSDLSRDGTINWSDLVWLANDWRHEAASTARP